MAGLHITTSNMMEILAARLADVISEPLNSPLAEEVILINSRGMERWLSMQLADHHGICANMSFQFPRSFFMGLLEKVTGAAGSVACYQPDHLAWVIMKFLPEIIHQPGFEMIRHYFGSDDDTDPFKCYQLSRRIARVYDQYLVFRPEMLLNWEAMKTTDHDELWQAELWRILVRHVGKPHPAALFNLFRDKIFSSELDKVLFPERISLIGISSLPPLFIYIIYYLAAITDIHLFLFNPCREYWSEIMSEGEMEHRIQNLRQKAERNLSAEDLLLEKGNPLLASMGKISRDFLSAFADDSFQHQDIFVNPGESTMLQAVQSDILSLVDRSKDNMARLPFSEGDRSLEIHSCHSPMRETEVLYDRLLALFEEDPKLMPRDILVMAPDINTYAPLIETVFNRVDGEAGFGGGSRIPFSIADRGHERNNPVTDAFFKILELPDSRFEASKVLALLDNPLIRNAFRISEDETTLLRRWVNETGIRWGIDGKALRKLDLPSCNGHTWRHGIDRMLLGYALPGDGAHLFGTLLPYGVIEGENTDILGLFLDFLDVLFSTCERLRVNHSPEQWQEILTELCTRFLKIEEDDVVYFDYRHLLNVFQDLSDIEKMTGFSDGIPLSIIREYLEEMIENRMFSGGFLSGGVTFCAMVPMRSIPCKVICLLGMDHGHFPRESTHLSFDLISSHPRRGDRSKRDDDRGLFLETLLSARDRLMIFYTGQNIRDNTVIPVSVVVDELFDYIDKAFVPPATPFVETIQNYQNQSEFHKRLVIAHPLQPFSPDYFKEDSRLFSYNREHCLAALSLAAQSEFPGPFLTTPLPPDPERLSMVTIMDLLLFFRNPARFFVEKRLRIQLRDEEEIYGDEESFNLKALDRYEIAQSILETRISGNIPEQEYHILSETGKLPSGAVGKNQYQALGPEVERFAARIRHFLPEPCRRDIAVDLTIDEFRLTGQITLPSPQGLFIYRFSDLKGKDYLKSWLLHLILHTAVPEHPWRNCLAGRNAGVVFEAPGAPADILQEIIKLMQNGLTMPLPFFPHSSLQYAAAISSGKSQREALQAARKAWQSTDFNRGGEGNDSYFQLCFGKADPLDEAFCNLALTIYSPMLTHRRNLYDILPRQGESVSDIL